MREIKFRCYDTNRKRMYKVLSLHVKTLLNGGTWATVEGFSVAEHKEIHIQSQPEDAKIMQFTGLMDADDESIFEGDILCGTFETFDDGPQEYRGEVIFSDGGFWVDFGELSVIAKKCQVIGNIYEHPDLLK